jgi:hypothetical protein
MVSDVWASDAEVERLAQTSRGRCWPGAAYSNSATIIYASECGLILREQRLVVDATLKISISCLDDERLY